MVNTILDIITEYSVNEGMNDILFRNEEYKKLQRDMVEQMEQFDALNLPKEQRLVVDGLLSSYTEEGALYGRMAYQKGFRDCAVLLREIGLLKAS